MAALVAAAFPHADVSTAFAAKASEAATGPLDAVRPSAFALGLAAPNPVATTARVALTLDADATVEVAVYDALGRRVALLTDGPLAAGLHALTFRASDLASGVYIVRGVVRAEGVSARVAVQRLTVAR